MMKAASCTCHRGMYPIFVNQGSQVCVIGGNVNVYLDVSERK